MSEQILGMLQSWSESLQLQPLWGTIVSVALGLMFVGGLGWVLGRRLSGGSGVSSGPIFVVSGMIVLGLCCVWAGVDAIFWATGAPYLSERILMWLAPDGWDLAALAELLHVSLGDGRLLLPAAISMTIGLVAAGFLYLGITWAIGGTLAELLALEQKPDDILARERKLRNKAIAEAIAAGRPPPDDVATRPLPDDRFGRVYKLLGHWTDVHFVEWRFLRWQKTVIKALGILTGLALFAALFRSMPIPLWVGATVSLIAFAHNLRTPPEPAVAKDAGDDEDGEDEEAPRPPPPFTDHREIEDHLAPAPLPRDADAPPPRSVDPELDAAHLLDDVLAAIDIPALYAHQALALRALGARDSVLLETPPGSGRRALADALALYTVLADAERVLVVCRDRAEARRAEAAFAARAEATHWKWNVLAVNLADRAGVIDPEAVQPGLVFADPETIHHQLCARQGRWHELLAGLGVVVIPEIHVYSGVRAAHLIHLMRRLERGMRRARIAATGRGLAAIDTTRVALRYFATCDPGYGDAGRYAERICGRPFVVVGAGRDGKPRPAQSHHTVLPSYRAGADRHPAVALRDLARAEGWRAELEGYGELLTEVEHAAEVDLTGADVVIARMTAARYPALARLTAHAGSPASVHPVGVLWQPDAEPFAGFLAETRPGPDHPALRYGRSLVAHGTTPAVERAHLRCSLGEGEVSLDELTRVFSRDLLAGVLADLRERGWLVEHEREILDVGAGAVTSARSLSLATREDVHADVSLRACAAPWQLVERATGEVVTDLDGARASSAAYPGRVLVRGGRRYVVLPWDSQDQTAQRRVLCEVADEPMLTSPVRYYEIDLIERRAGDRRERSRDRAGGRDRRRGALLSLGGAGFSLQVRDVAVTEEAQGVRRYRTDGTLRDEIFYDETRRCRYATRATLLGMPKDSFGDVTGASLHALVHLVRQVLPMYVSYAEEDLEVTSGRIDDEGPEVPTLCFLDLHPEGAGFAEAVTLDVVRHVLTWSAALAARGEACLATTTCHAIPEIRPNLDLEGAARLLARALGSSAPGGAAAPDALGD